MSLEQLKQLPFSITAILQGLRLYPAEHPQIQKQLQNSVNTLNTLLDEYGKLTIGLLDGTLLLNDIPCLEQLPALQELIRLFDKQQLQAVEILPGIDQPQLLRFCQEIPHMLGGEFPEKLERIGLTGIRATLKDEELEGPAAIYKKALAAVEDVCHDVRLGRIPSSYKVIKTARGMVRTILEEPFALLALSMLKDYDNYTFSHSVNVSVIAMSVGKACGLSKQELFELGVGRTVARPGENDHRPPDRRQTG